MLPRQEQADRASARGMLLGLALGDALAVPGGAPTAGTLHAGVATQLACFTVEGVIRAFVRGAHRGIWHPPTTVWHAYCRWAALQGVEPERLGARWRGAAGSPWPDGWLAQVPALAQRRGDAPATVAALRGLRQGTVDEPVGRSAGSHALTRTLPLGVLPDVRRRARLARDLAALTHGDPSAHAAAAQGALLVGEALRHDEVAAALAAGQRAVEEVAPDEQCRQRFDEALHGGATRPGSPTELQAHARDGTAVSALAGGAYLAASFPAPGGLEAALHLAGSTQHGRAAAAVAGALLGAVHGADLLPVRLLARHELAWVLDVLAHDLLAELTERPGGGERVAASDPHWSSRYPGW